MPTASRRRRQRSLREQEVKAVGQGAEQSVDPGEGMRAPRSRATPPILPEAYNEDGAVDLGSKAPHCKQARIEDGVFGGTANGAPSQPPEGATEPPKDERCEACLQFLDDPDCKQYSGDLPDALEELDVLLHPSFTCNVLESNDAPIDCFADRPDFRVALFSVYDQYGHLCQFDNGLVERNVELWFSGVIKPLDSANGGDQDGVVAKRLGPIAEWWISGYERQDTTLGFTTAYADYSLLEPSPQYRPYMQSAWEKIYVSKSVVEFVAEHLDATFDDLLEHVQSATPPAGVAAITQDALLAHAQFVVDQIAGFDSTAAMDESLLLTTPCILALIQMAGVSLWTGVRKQRRLVTNKTGTLKKKSTVATDTKATTTPLVDGIIGNFFPQLTQVGSAAWRKEQCGVCAGCLQPDCGRCKACKAKKRKKGKVACTARVCLNFAVQEANDDDAGGEEDEDCDSGTSGDQTQERPVAKVKKQTKTVSRKSSVVWSEKPSRVRGTTKYFESVLVNDEPVQLGEHVLVELPDATGPFRVARVISLYEDGSGTKMAHLLWYLHGSDTVLGETSDPQEVFVVDDCSDVRLQSVVGKCAVTWKVPPPFWSSLGGIQEAEPVECKDGKTFFCQKWYDPETGSFVDPSMVQPCKNRTVCTSCDKSAVKKSRETPRLGREIPDDQPSKSKRICYASVTWHDVKYCIDDCVLLHPEAFPLEEDSESTTPPSDRPPIDETLYPEHYRKSDYVRVTCPDVPKPFRVGRVLSIAAAPWRASEPPSAKQIFVELEVFYRPENTHLGPVAAAKMDINLLYWTRETAETRLSKCEGKCSVVHCEPEDGFSKNFSLVGPARFYFCEAYDALSKTFYDVPSDVACHFRLQPKKQRRPSRPTPLLPPGGQLRGMDLFAGCGGLSEGFHQVGVMDTLWAIEREEAAARAFSKNNPNCTVFQEDCNQLLKLVMDGHKVNDQGQSLPQKGEVQIIVGGPPCQGFSGMNRFNYRQYSLFKNSLIATFLSFCDFYRPRFVVMENVRNFVAFKKGMVLKLALRCFVRMGYQCRFGILQAGNYGVPQTRHRAILLAAAPGEKLPLYPEPSNVFRARMAHLTAGVDDKRYRSNIRWTDSAPYRQITVRDGMSDLPAIESGATCEKLSYATPPQSSFQRLVRNHLPDGFLHDHVCKGMSTLVVARMKYVPHVTGADWRDLPNVVVSLDNGEKTKPLKYTHHDVRNGKAAAGALRGVCTCAEGKACEPMYRQFNTLIPWCLPHTGNRHNNWAGLYGRLSWDGFFLTTVTNPEPMGKQGTVVHPEQDRVVSVRECARSQGFPDSYQFYGTILDRHRQIGNAVPPPMAAAIALEIVKCINDN